MKRLFVLLAIIFTVSVHAQERFNLCLTAGTGLVRTKGILFDVYGQFRGSTNELSVTIAPRFAVMGEFRLGRFRCATGFNTMIIPFRNVVHRYAIYYSPGGNQYGGDIYELYGGRYISIEIPVRADYYFLQREKICLGISGTATAGRIVYMKNEIGYEYNARESYGYLMCSAGPSVEFPGTMANIAIRPHALFVIAQQGYFFRQVGGLIEVTVGFKWPQRAGNKG